ncbi:aldo/keto reductase [Streptomyces sp. NPDC045470]|uniref:aldo/keto reductase n=1 Tax=Streptomyces sp. NPDC045470 TaxID=3155469 RepID=UPI0033E5CD79
MTAALGLGTHRVREVAVAVELAAASPAPWIDTAPNYLGGRAHDRLAPALAAHPTVPVATKVGFLNAVALSLGRAAGVVPAPDVAAGHSLAASYVRWQAEQNRAALGRGRLAALFLHNPERTCRPDRLHEQLREAFTVLEELAATGAVQTYGVATWNGFDTGVFTIADLDRLATEAAGRPDHHLRVIQLPVSLVAADAFTLALHGRGPITEAAGRGWAVHASAPLHGGELPHLATPELAALLNPGLSIAQACLLAVASCPGVSRVLLSASHRAHWNAALGALAADPIPPTRLRSVLDVLAAPRPG